MKADSSTSSQTAQTERVSKYITFTLSTEEYGIELLKLRELIGVPEITRIPRSKHFIRGLINLRGKVIPVVDLRTRFGMPTAEPTSQSVIIVVQLTTGGVSTTTGILVDEVLEVRAIEQDDVEPPPTLNEQVDTSFILGVGKVEKRIVFLLDIDKVLTPEQQLEIRSAVSEIPAAAE